MVTYLLLVCAPLSAGLAVFLHLILTIFNWLIEVDLQGFVYYGDLGRTFGLLIEPKRDYWFPYYSYLVLLLYVAKNRLDAKMRTFLA
jgi:hypothetical protein